MATTSSPSAPAAPSDRRASADSPPNSTTTPQPQEANDVDGARSTRRRRQFVNAMGPVETPKKAPTETRRSAPRDAAPVEERERSAPREDRAVPEEIKQRFVAAGNVYYFADGARAFVDRGDR